LSPYAWPYSTLQESAKTELTRSTCERLLTNVKAKLVCRTLPANMMRNALCLLALVLGFASGMPAATQEAGNSPREAASSVSVYLFWTATCPHCAKAREHLSGLAAREPSNTPSTAGA
jgi:hypothetical protein